MSTITISGLDYTEFEAVLASGIDHGGNPIESFIEADRGWPLRCCLADSEAGDEIAIIAWSPFSWKGAYAETGPVVVHAQPCGGPTSSDLPTDLDQRSMTLRPYGHDQRIAYQHVRHVPAGESLSDNLRELLAEDNVDFVHGRNTTGGCFSFTANRA